VPSYRRGVKYDYCVADLRGRHRRISPAGAGKRLGRIAAKTGQHAAIGSLHVFDRQGDMGSTGAAHQQQNEQA
jgi:hypothetical protein